MPVDKARMDFFGDWLLKNEALKGTPDYVSAAEDYRNMRREYDDTTPSGTGMAAGAKDAYSAGIGGLNRAFGGFLDAPGNLLRFGLNKASNALGQGNVLDPEGGSWLTKKMDSAGMIPPKHGWDMTHNVGSGVGTGLMTALTAGLGSAFGLAANAPKTAAVLDALGPASTATRTLASNVGGTVAQEWAQEATKKAGAGPLLQGIAGIAAPMTPALLAFGLKNTAGRGLAAMGRQEGNNSSLLYDALTAAGITPTPGLLGRQWLARMENAATYIPFFAAGERARDKSFQQFQNRVYDTADDLGRVDTSSNTPTSEKGEFSINSARSTGIPDQPTVGARFQDAAREGHVNLTDDLKTQQNDIERTIGEQTLVPPGNTEARLRGIGETEVNGQPRLRTDPDSNVNVQSEVDKFNASRVPRHAPAEGLLLSEIRVREQMLQNPRLRPNERATLTSELEALNARLSDNRQVPYEALKDLSTNAGYGATGGGREPLLNNNQIGQARDAYRDLQQGAADRAGIGGDFRAANERYRLAHDADIPLREGGDVPYLDDLRRKPTGQDAYNNVMSEGRWERADTIMRNNPDAVPGMRRDMLLSTSEAPVRNQTKDIEVSPMALTARWRSMSPEMRDRIAPTGTPERAELDNLMKAGQAFMDRSGTMNFSNTAPSAATSVTMGNLVQHPLKTLGALGSSMATGAMAINPSFAEQIAGRYQPLLDPRLRQAGSAAAQAGSRDLAESIYGRGR